VQSFRFEPKTPTSDGAIRVFVDVDFSANDASRVIELIGDLYRLVDRPDASSDLDLDYWTSVLPSWFVNGCRPEMTADAGHAETEHFLGLSSEEKAAYMRDSRWTLSAWLARSVPGHRTWRRIVDVRATGAGRAVIRLDTDDPNESLRSIIWAVHVADEAVASGGVA
jgi:hypothetical protein